MGIEELKQLDKEVWIFATTKIGGIIAAFYFFYTGNIPYTALSVAIVSLFDTMEARYQLKKGEL